MKSDLWISVRPKHWIKNILVFAAPVFAQEMTSFDPLIKVAAAFVIFCLLSSANYLLNDIVDAAGDRIHPLKKTRPIASGDMKAWVAGGIALIAAAVGIGLAYLLNGRFGNYAALFVFIHILYSLILRRIVILDVFTLAAGYILRVMAGAAVIGVPLSPWLIICTLLLSLFLGLSARALDFKLLGTEAARHRTILAHYNPYLLDQMISVISSAVLITYTLYTISPVTTARFHSDKLALTIPMVLYGIFRYLYLIHKGEAHLSVERALISDKPMRINAILYIAVTLFVIYW